MNKKQQEEMAPTTSQEKQKTCFIIMPISDIDKYPSGHFRRVYEYLIEPACRKAGFKAKRADDIKSANVIMLDVLESILHYDMAICDLSASNPNVLYELGIRQSFDMPVTLIKDEITKDIFDIQGIRYMPYDSQLRIDKVAETIELLAASISETYESRDKDVSSLVQILGREKAKIKTNELSGETSIVLDAIAQLNEKIKQIRNPNESRISPAHRIRLLNGLVIRAGDAVFHDSLGDGIVSGVYTSEGEPRFSVSFPSGDKVFLAHLASGFSKRSPPLA